MNPAIEELLTAIYALSEEDRHELIEILISSEDPSYVEMDEELRAIIERRSEEIASGRAQTVSWEEVQRRARETIELADQRNCELESGAVQGLTHDEVMQSVRRSLRCE